MAIFVGSCLVGWLTSGSCHRRGAIDIAVAKDVAEICLRGYVYSLHWLTVHTELQGGWLGTLPRSGNCSHDHDQGPGGGCGL